MVESKEIIKTIRDATGLSQKAFAQRYSIPLRTIENWEGGQTVPPPYLIGLLWRVVFELDFVENLPDIDSGNWAQDIV